MTPLEIEILLHYYTRVDDYRDGDFSAPAVASAIGRFVNRLNLLETSSDDSAARYVATSRAVAYVEMLKEVPLPVEMWVALVAKEPTAPNSLSEWIHRARNHA